LPDMRQTKGLYAQIRNLSNMLQVACLVRQAPRGDKVKLVVAGMDINTGTEKFCGRMAAKAGEPSTETRV